MSMGSPGPHIRFADILRRLRTSLILFSSNFIIGFKLSLVLQELKQIMAQHGGMFINYYSRDRVSHIICSNLPDAKVKHNERERYLRLLLIGYVCLYISM